MINHYHCNSCTERHCYLQTDERTTLSCPSRCVKHGGRCDWERVSGLSDSLIVDLIERCRNFLGDDPEEKIPSYIFDLAWEYYEEYYHVPESTWCHFSNFITDSAYIQGEEEDQIVGLESATKYVKKADLAKYFASYGFAAGLVEG